MTHRRPYLALLTAAAACALLTACDGQTAQINASQQKLDRVLGAFDTAQQGYTDPGAEQATDRQAFRQQTLQSTVDDLQAVINEGSAQQQDTARQLLATVHRSAARYAVRDALAEYASLAARSPVLVSNLNAAERAAARARATGRDHDAVLAQIAADVNNLTQKRDQHQQQAQALRDQIDQHQQQRDQLRAQADEHMAQARQLLDKAFLAEGQDQIDLHDQADAAKRKAAEASTQAEKHQVDLDLLQRRLSVAEKQVETVESQITELKDQAERTRAAQAETQKAVEQARQAMQQHAEALKQEFDQLSTVYDQTVADLFASAADHAAQGVDLLSGAGADQKLAARIDQAHVNTEWAITAASWANVLDMLATDSAEADLPSAEAYAQARQRIADEHAAAAEAARQAIAAGRDLAEQQGDQGAGSTDLLAGYEKRLQQNTLD